MLSSNEKILQFFSASSITIFLIESIRRHLMSVNEIGEETFRTLKRDR